MKTGVILVTISCIVISVWLIGYCHGFEWLEHLDTLFSGLAFVGLIATIIYQQKELNQNTAALNAQKDEMVKQWEEMEKQNTNINHQRFESSLFSMMNLHFQIRNQIKIESNVGILGFKVFLDHIIHYSKEPTGDNIFTSKLISSVPIVDKQLGLLTIAEPYISSLKVIYNSIKQSGHDKESESRYIYLTQSYLTNFEVMFIVLYYNYLATKQDVSTLSQMYKDLDIGKSFSYRIKNHYELKLIVDSGIV